MSYFCSLSPLTVRRGQESNVGNDYGCYKQDARQLDHTMPVPSPSQAKGDTYECMVSSSGVMMGVVSAGAQQPQESRFCLKMCGRWTLGNDMGSGSWKGSRATMQTVRNCDIIKIDHILIMYF